MGMDDEDDDEQMVDMIMEHDHDVGCALRDNIIPFAVRWYTGEASPQDDDDDEDEDDEEYEVDIEASDEEDSEDDEDEEDEVPAKAGKKGATKKDKVQSK